MSEVRTIIAQSVSDRSDYTSERCRYEPTGRIFQAEYEEIVPLDLVTELGSDPRECGYLHITDKAAIAEISAQNKVTVWLYGIAQSFTVVNRENNPGSSQAKFKLKYNVPTKDA